MAVSAQQQDLLFNTAIGQKTSVTTTATILTTGAYTVFAWIETDAAIVVNPDGGPSVDDGSSFCLPAGFAGILPVSPSTAITALSLSGTAVVRAMAMKPRG